MNRDSGRRDRVSESKGEDFVETDWKFVSNRLPLVCLFCFLVAIILWSGCDLVNSDSDNEIDGQSDILDTAPYAAFRYREAPNVRRRRSLSNSSTDVTMSTSEPSSEPASEPTTEPASEPHSEPASEPTSEPASEPHSEPASEPTSEPASEPHSEPASEPHSEPASEPHSEPASEPHSEPASEPHSEPASEPHSEPASEPTSEPEAESSPGGIAEPEAERNVTSEPSPEPGPLVKKYVFLGILSLLLVLILFTNICLMVTILKCKPLRKPANMIVLSLAVSDICIALFVITGMISGQFSERYMVNIICKVCHYASHMSLAAASLSLVAIAGDRLKAIALPLKPKMTMGESGIVVAVVWGLSLAYGFRVPFLFTITPVLVMSESGGLITRMICAVPLADSQTNAPIVVLDFLLVFAIPALTIAISYAALLYFLSKNSMKTTGAKKNKKALRLSIFMIAMFIVCHMPVHTFRLYLSRDHAIVPESFDLIRAFDIISIINSVLNPIVYGFLNKQIRDGFFELLGKTGHFKGLTGHNRVHPNGHSGPDISKNATVASDTAQTTTIPAK